MATLNYQQLVAAINQPSYEFQISNTVTLTINDKNGEMLGFSSGPTLNMYLVDMLNTYLGAVNAERTRRLEALTGQSSYTLRQVAQAAVDPLVEALSGPDSRIVLFCHRAILQEGVDIDGRYWWTPKLYEVLQRYQEFTPGSSRKLSQRVGATLNFTLYHFVGRDRSLGWINKLPLIDQDRDDYREWLCDVAAAILQPPNPNR